jgi:hypothetical protein
MNWNSNKPSPCKSPTSEPTQRQWITAACVLAILNGVVFFAALSGYAAEIDWQNSEALKLAWSQAERVARVVLLVSIAAGLGLWRLYKLSDGGNDGSKV